jgi:hypothetical protein
MPVNNGYRNITKARYEGEALKDMPILRHSACTMKQIYFQYAYATEDPNGLRMAGYSRKDDLKLKQSCSGG